MKRLIWLVLALFFIGTAIGQPFVQDTPVAGALTVSYPQVPEFRFGEDLIVHTHVYNSSGYILDNNTVEYCTLHLYHRNNSEALEVNMTEERHEFKYTVDKSYIEDIGNYPFTIFCVSGNLGGFTSGALSVSKDGLVETSEGMLPVAILYIGLLFFLGYLMNSLSVRDDAGNFVKINVMLKLILAAFIMLMSFLGIQTMYGTVQTYNLSPFVESSIKVLYQYSVWTYIILLFLLLLGMGINFFMAIIKWMGGGK